MWAVIKFHQKRFGHLKKDFSKKLDGGVKFYSPKLRIQKFKKSKFYFEKLYLLGDYLLCFHKEFSKTSTINSLKYCKGLKYFLTDFSNNQNEINTFISKCKENEDKEGFISQTFFNYSIDKKLEFISGPFSNLIFDIFEENNSSIKTLMGKYKVTVSKKNNLFRPI